MKKIMLSSMLTLLALSASVASASEQIVTTQNEPLDDEITQILDTVTTNEKEQVDLETQIADAQNNNDQVKEEQLQVQLEQKEKVQEQITASIIAAQPEVVVQSEVTPLSQLNIQSMDIETALMAVQSERTRLLEDQLRSQIAAVEDRNSQINKLNDALSQLNKASAILPADAKADTKLNLSNETIQAIQNAGIAIPTTDISKAELDTMSMNLKSMIDSQSNSQQMDMLRLQSLSNKRNEAFEVMTNFLKKMQDSRSSIIGNMR
ncbi:hypothetical protein [Paenibacillus sp. DS2015]|uniref:hypothetical protein n=1 Tax=Paenibacillus sp. DS2015 TaxID=3373917 RepID=UPI003D22C812